MTQRVLDYFRIIKVDYNSRIPRGDIFNQTTIIYSGVSAGKPNNLSHKTAHHVKSPVSIFQSNSTIPTIPEIALPQSNSSFAVPDISTTQRTVLAAVPPLCRWILTTNNNGPTAKLPPQRRSNLRRTEQRSRRVRARPHLALRPQHSSLSYRLEIGFCWFKNTNLQP